MESGQRVWPGVHAIPGGGGDGPQRESGQPARAVGVDQCSIGVPPQLSPISPMGTSPLSLLNKSLRLFLNSSIFYFLCNGLVALVLG